MDDVLGTGPELDGDPPPPPPEQGPGWVALTLRPAALALSSLVLSVSGVLSTGGGVASRVAAVFARDEEGPSFYPGYSASLTKAQAVVMGVAALLGWLALWRRTDERAWWEPVAGAGILLAVLVAGTAIAVELTIDDPDPNQVFF